MRANEKLLIHTWEQEAECERVKKSAHWFVLIASVLLTIILMSLFLSTAYADVNNDDAVMAIIGEAENQGYQGMTAVACGIRNRDSLNGVFGKNAPRVKNHQYSENTKEKAIMVWEYSADPENCAFLDGADHWENIKAFGKPLWANKMVETYRYKDHVFYREAR